MSRTSPVPFTLQEGLHCERGAAKIFGTDCAIVLQRFIWWTYPNKSKLGTIDENGNKWVYFTMDDLVDEFDWLSKSTLWRIINLLEANHILLSKQPEGKASRRKHYSISWPMWIKIQSGAYSKIGNDGKLIPSQIDGIPSGQIEGMGSIQFEAFPSNLEYPRTHLDKESSTPSSYLQPDKDDLGNQARLDSQSSSLKAAPSQKAEGTPSSAAPRKKQFSPPSVDECVAYGDSIGLPCIEAEKFLNYHESRGWIVGGFPMRSWQAAMRTWKGFWQSRMSERFSGNTPTKPKSVWLQIKELEARIESHAANHNRLGYDRSKSTPEAKEEWKRMKQTLKDLQAGQPQAEEGAIP